MIVSPGELWALASGKRRGLKLNDVALKRGACEMEQDQLQTEGAAAVTKAGAASQAGPLFSGEVLDVLETHLAAPEFLDKIEAARASTTQGVELTPSHNAGPQPSRPSAPPGDAPAPAEPADDYVMIDQEDAVQSLAYYIAQCLVRCPEAQKLKPEELQTALCTSFKAMRRSSFRQALAWGRRAYRLTAIGYSAIQVYQNPWLVQAVLTALWSFSKLSLRFFA